MTNSWQRDVRWGGVALLLVMVAGAFTGVGIWCGTTRRIEPAIRSLAPTVTQLERIGELAVTRVHVADVLSAEGEGYRGSWLVKGDALLSCTVSHARIGQVNPAARTAVIHLPPLRVVSARVDHEKTKVWSVEKATWLPWKWGDQGVLRDAAMFHAQQLVENAAGSDRNLTPAKAQAELLIRQMYDLVEWKVTVTWAE